MKQIAIRAGFSNKVAESYPTS